METTRALTLPSNRSVYTGGVVAYEVSAGGVPRTGRIYPPPTSTSRPRPTSAPNATARTTRKQNSVRHFDEDDDDVWVDSDDDIDHAGLTVIGSRAPAANAQRARGGSAVARQRKADKARESRDLRTSGVGGGAAVFRASNATATAHVLSPPPKMGGRPATASLAVVRRRPTGGAMPRKPRQPPPTPRSPTRRHSRAPSAQAPWDEADEPPPRSLPILEAKLRDWVERNRLRHETAGMTLAAAIYRAVPECAPADAPRDVTGIPSELRQRLVKHMAEHECGRLPGDDARRAREEAAPQVTTDGTFVSAPSAFRSMETQKFETLANQLGERQALSKQPMSLTRAQFALGWRALAGESGELGGAITEEEVRTVFQRFASPPKKLMLPLSRFVNSVLRGDLKRLSNRSRIFLAMAGEPAEKKMPVETSAMVTTGAPGGGGFKDPSQELTDAPASSRTLAGMKVIYAPCRRAVYPPTGFKMGLVQRARAMPEVKLKLGFAYGMSVLASNTAVMLPDGERCVFVTAALGVVMTLPRAASAADAEQEELTESELGPSQIIFEGHDDDVTALAVDKSGVLAATGQCGHNPRVCIWRTADGVLSGTALSLGEGMRFVCALSFGGKHDDRLVAICADNHHTCMVYHAPQRRRTPSATQLTWQLMCQGSCINGQPPSVFGVSFGLPDSDSADVFVTYGKRHLRFWEPQQETRFDRETYACEEATFGGAKSKQDTLSACALPSSTVDKEWFATGHPSGEVYFWRNRKISFILAIQPEKTPGSVPADAQTSGNAVAARPTSVPGTGKSKATPAKPMSHRDAALGVRSLTLTEDGSLVAGCLGGTVALDVSLGMSGKTDLPLLKSGARMHAWTVAAASQKPHDVAVRGMDRKRATLQKQVVHVSARGDGVWLAATASGELWRLWPIGDEGTMDAEIVLHPHVFGCRVPGVAPHPGDSRYFASVGDGDSYAALWDGTLCTRSASLYLGDDTCVRAAAGANAGAYHLARRARSCALRPSAGDVLAVGFSDGAVRLYACRSAWSARGAALMNPAILLDRPGAGRGCEILKFAPHGNALAAGYRSGNVDVFGARRRAVDVPQEWRLACTLRGHSALIRSLDWDAAGVSLKSCDSAMELLYWDARRGCPLHSDVRDVPWQADSTSLLGFEVQGIWAPDFDPSDIGAVTVSPSGGGIVATGDDYGQIRVFHYPCCASMDAMGDSASAACVTYRGYHSAHVASVRFACDDSFLFSTGGRDGALLAWCVEGSTLLPSREALKAERSAAAARLAGPRAPVSTSDSPDAALKQLLADSRAALAAASDSDESSEGEGGMNPEARRQKASEDADRRAAASLAVRKRLASIRKDMRREVRRLTRDERGFHPNAVKPRADATGNAMVWGELPEAEGTSGGLGGKAFGWVSAYTPPEGFISGGGGEGGGGGGGDLDLD